MPRIEFQNAAADLVSAPTTLDGLVLDEIKKERDASRGEIKTVLTGELEIEPMNLGEFHLIMITLGFKLMHDDEGARKRIYEYEGVLPAGLTPGVTHLRLYMEHGGDTTWDTSLCALPYKFGENRHLILLKKRHLREMAREVRDKLHLPASPGPTST